MIIRTNSRVSKSMFKGKYSNFRFTIPTEWRDNFEQNQIVILKFNQFSFPVNLNESFRITIPKPVVEWFEIDKSFSAILALDTNSNTLVLDYLECLE